jgi:peroxiredoxin
MNARTNRSWWFVTIALWLVAGATLAAETGKNQTLSPVAKPFIAPEFALKGEDGRTYRLADYRGKVVVLNFWATWCPPCRYEMPSMEHAHEKLKGENIVILAINVGEDANTIFAFTGQYPVSFPLPLDVDGSVTRKYPIVGLPTTFIIDSQGNVTHRAIGGRDWDSDQILGQLRKMQKP